MSQITGVRKLKSGLDSEMEKFSVLLMSDKFDKLETKEKILLKRQHTHMRSLSEILGQRLATK